MLSPNDTAPLSFIAMLSCSFFTIRRTRPWKLPLSLLSPLYRTAFRIRKGNLMEAGGINRSSDVCGRSFVRPTVRTCFKIFFKNLPSDIIQQQEEEEGREVIQQNHELHIVPWFLYKDNSSPYTVFGEIYVGPIPYIPYIS